MNLWILFISFFFLTACSQLKTENEQNSPSSTSTTSSEKEKILKSQELLEGPESLDSISSRLILMEEKVKAKGPSAILFFTTDLYLKASRSEIEEDFSLALILYKHLLRFYPKDNFLKFKLAICLIRLGELQEAKEVLSGLYRESKDEKIGLILAGIYSALLNKRDAEAIYLKIAQKKPEHIDSCLLLSNFYQQEGEYKKALGALDFCGKSKKNETSLDYHRGKLFLEQGDNERAIAYFEKSFHKDSDNPLLILALGGIYEKQENFNKAYGVYKKYLSRDPSHSEILSRMVKILFILEKFSEAIPYLQTLTHIEPDDLNLKVKLGVLYADARRYAEAKVLFLEILKEVPSSDKVHFYLGSVYSENMEYLEALSSYEGIEKGSPYYHDALIQQAQILSVLSSDPNEGMSFSKKLISLVEEKSQESAETGFTLKIILVSYYERLKDFKKGISLLESVKGEKQFTDNHRYYLATLYEKNKEGGQAKLIAEEIVKKNPHHAHAWNFLGYYALENGDKLDKAYSYIKKAMALSPEDPFIRDSLGRYYFKKGEMGKALKEFLFAREQVRDDSTISKHLAELYLTMKNYSLAKQYFLEALKNDRQGEDNDVIQKQLDALEKQDRLPASSSSSFD